MRKINQFLKTELNSLPEYSLSPQDTNSIKKVGVAECIFEKITARKFRRSSMPPELKQNIRNSIGVKVNKSEPITFAVPIGGYKKRELACAPYVDWSEFFTLAYMYKFAAPILAVYAPGVAIEYVSNEIDMEILGNYTREELKAYTDTFKQLLSYFKKSFPVNFKIIYREMREQFAPGEYVECLEEARPDLDSLLKKWNELSKNEQKSKIAKAERNYKFSSDEEKLSDNEKYEILKRITLTHDMYVNPIWLGFLSKKNYIRNDNKIPISYYHGNWGLHLGSCSASTVQFWVGTGVLEQRGERIIPQILSYKQLQAVKDKIHPESVDSLIDMPNFAKIGVVRC
ncbi:hypothetical protein KKB83_03180 [Patescibacteria group bacterium]|nr:hypothetical protein [Patescibacteria group bacterium]